MKSLTILSLVLIAGAAVMTLGSSPAQAAGRLVNEPSPMVAQAPGGVLVQGPDSIPKANWAEGQSIAGWLNQTDPDGKTGQPGRTIYLARQVIRGCNQYTYYFIFDVNPATGKPYGWTLYEWANICSD